jgi:hypothetical protein
MLKNGRHITDNISEMSLKYESPVVTLRILRLNVNKVYIPATENILYVVRISVHYEFSH